MNATIERPEAPVVAELTPEQAEGFTRYLAACAAYGWTLRDVGDRVPAHREEEDRERGDLYREVRRQESRLHGLRLGSGEFRHAGAVWQIGGHGARLVRYEGQQP
jgi:hypothetical protein